MNDPAIGHNSEVGGAELLAFIERVERVQSDIDDRNGDKSEIYQEMKSRGFDTRAVKKLVARRRLDPAARAEQDAILEIYQTAIESIDGARRHG